MNDLQSEIQGPMGCLLCLLWGLTRRGGRRLLDGRTWDDMLGIASTNQGDSGSEHKLF